ncbi:type II toxin-antitoxin system RelB/DinJ family antitoxin [Orbaceae bacterium ac157xtp]
MTTYIRSIVDEKMKQQAEQTLKAMGLDMSTYMRMALAVLIQERRIPFEVKLTNIPNETTLKAMAELKEKRTRGEYRNLTPDELFNELEENS